MIIPRWLLAGLASALIVAHPARADKPPVDFGREVRPILDRSCIGCHGADKQKGGLRLDRRDAAMAGGDSGRAILAGKAAESDLIARVRGEDAETAMPPKGDRLTPAEVATLARWVDQGASWPDAAGVGAGVKSSHWAFQPVVRPSVPLIKNNSWIRSPIDAFVGSKLESLGLSPSPEADRPTLIRRLSLDLLGLPPTAEEVSTFVDDLSINAYEKIVDRLLASPHHGERWGRHWLDLARYADSDGYEKDNGRPHAWRFRNWVIDAINRDLPFDKFTVEQLAGDLLPGATVEQRVATGFHRNTLTNTEGGTDPEEFRVAAVVDRTNTTGTVWLGLTVGCAQCHTHKYDPILHRDYYGLFAFFNGDDEVNIPAPIPSETENYNRAKAAFDTGHAPIVAALRDHDEKTRPASQMTWESSLPTTAPRWVPMTPIGAASAEGATPTIRPDGSIAFNGVRPAADIYTINLRSDLAGITALRIEALVDDGLPGKGPGRADNGNFVLCEVSARAAPRDGEASTPVPLQNPSADFAQEGFAPAATIDGDPKTGWAVGPKMGGDHVLILETKADVGGPGGSVLTLTLDQRYGGRHTLGRLRASAIAAPRPVRLDSVLPEGVAKALAVAADKRTDADRGRIADHHRSIDPRYQQLNKAVLDHLTRAPKPPSTMAQTLADARSPRPTHIHLRGDFRRQGDEVRPHTPEVLPPLRAEATPTRLDLARWLVDPGHPLTARVAVNRTWKHLLGRALTPTVDDLGTRGEPPSHPELLDWLAAEYPALGWSQKRLIRAIVTSATYRQASAHRPELAERDPNNVWLARQGRFRPEAEVVRDLALAAAGLLNPAVGGPSVRPPQPAGVSDLTYAGSARWVESTGADRYRRGMYTWFQRTSPYPMLMTFDAPESNVCSARRERSNTPLQALTLLNDATFVECARAMGRRVGGTESCGCTDCRVSAAMRLALAREPSEAEAAVLGNLLARAVAAYRLHPEEAALLLGPGKVEGDSAEMAGCVVLSRAIMNLDEFVTRE